MSFSLPPNLSSPSVFFLYLSPSPSLSLPLYLPYLCLPPLSLTSVSLLSLLPLSPSSLSYLCLPPLSLTSVSLLSLLPLSPSSFSYFCLPPLSLTSVSLLSLLPLLSLFLSRSFSCLRQIPLFLPPSPHNLFFFPTLYSSITIFVSFLSLSTFCFLIIRSFSFRLSQTWCKVKFMATIVLNTITLYSRQTKQSYLVFGKVHS